jgi:hypothetical protein
MTEQEKEALRTLMGIAMSRWEGINVNRQEEALNAQSYISGLIALQLDRIATALERPTPNYDPHVSTALNRIAEATEGLLSVLPRQ